MRWPIGFERRSLVFRPAGGHNQTLVTVRYGVGHFAWFTRSVVLWFCKQPDDLVAAIKTCSTDEGGRLKPPFDGIRRDVVARLILCCRLAVAGELGPPRASSRRQPRHIGGRGTRVAFG
jgi:hypothetical protein